MNDQDSNKDRDNICCENGDCCATTATGGGWKTIVFTVIIILAVGVAGYSLFLREPNSTASGCDPATCTTTNCDAATSCLPKTTTGGGSNNAVKDFDEQLKDLDLAVLLFIYNDDQISRDDFTAVKQATRSFDKRGIKSRVSIVYYEDRLFRTGLKRFGISRLPALVLYTKSGSETMVVDNLTIDAILDSYDNISASSGTNDKKPMESSGT